jgi:uncharacterized protein YsxB (DUF464 family)
MNDVFQYGLTTAVVIIGYFLRIVHNDVRKAVEDTGKLKGKIELVEQENRLKYQQILETTQLEIRNLTKNIGDLTEVVKEIMIKINK